MDRPFRRGLAVGILGPLAFAAGIIYWVYRYTHKIPFPVSEPAEGQLTIGLVEPSEVSTYWQPWRDSLCEIRAKFMAMAKDLKAELESGED